MLRVLGLLAIFALGGAVSLAFNDYLEDQQEMLQKLREDVEQMEGLCK